MKTLTKRGVPLTPSRRAPRPPRLALSELMRLAATHRIKVEPKSELNTSFTYPWPLAHAASPVAIGMGATEHMARCHECDELKVDPDDFADGLRCRACVEKPCEHVGDGGGMGGCLETCVKCGAAL